MVSPLKAICLPPGRQEIGELGSGIGLASEPPLTKGSGRAPDGLMVVNSNPVQSPVTLSTARRGPPGAAAVATATASSIAATPAPNARRITQAF
jgi:hypothetical protein